MRKRLKPMLNPNTFHFDKKQLIIRVLYVGTFPHLHNVHISDKWFIGFREFVMNVLITLIIRFKYVNFCIYKLQQVFDRKCAILYNFDGPVCRIVIIFSPNYMTLDF